MSVTVTRTITVDRPVGPVGRYLCDFTSSGTWVPHNVSCVRVDDGPIRVGARYRTVARVGPLTETIEQVVVEYDAACRLVVEGSSQYLRTRDELSCRAVSAGTTEVVYTATVELVGRARVGSRALAPFAALVADQGAARLRRTLLDVVPPPVMRSRRTAVVTPMPHRLTS